MGHIPHLSNSCYNEQASGAKLFFFQNTLIMMQYKFYQLKRKCIAPEWKQIESSLSSMGGYA